MTKTAMTPNGELSIDVSQIAPVHLELESSRAHDVVGPYGAFVATMAPALPPAMEAPPPYAHTEWRAPTPPSGRALDVLADVPVAIWKRLALYGSLFFVFGNLLRCGGLSTLTNVTCALVVLFGLAGLVACAQRNP